MSRKKWLILLTVLASINIGFLVVIRDARQRPLVIDSSQMQCGHWSLVRCCHLLGVPISVSDVFELLPPRSRGHSLLELKEALEAVGLEVASENASLEQVLRSDAPTILHLTGPEHFVVATGRSESRIMAFNAVGNRSYLPFGAVKERFSGYALHVRRPVDAVLPKTVQRDPGSPCLQFDTLYVDNGDIAINSGPVTYEFPFRNLGSQRLVIHDVAADCGCLQVDFPREVPPHSRSVLKATFRHNPDSTRGSFEHEIMVRTNDPMFQAVSLVAAGNTNTTLRPWPLQLDFGQRIAGESHMLRCFLHYTGGDEHVIQRAVIECSFPDTEVRVLSREQFLRQSPPVTGLTRQRDVLRSVRVLEVTWKPPADTLPGNLSGTLTITVPEIALDPIRIPVSAVVVSRESVSRSAGQSL